MIATSPDKADLCIDETYWRLEALGEVLLLQQLVKTVSFLHRAKTVQRLWSIASLYEKEVWKKRGGEVPMQ